MSRLGFGAQLTVFAILGAILYGVFYMWFYSPMQVEIEEKTTTRRNLQAEDENAKTTAARLPEFRREVERKEATLQALSRILPSQKEVDDLLRKVQQLAAESSLDVLRFKPEATRPQQYYAEWPITLDLDGSYHNLAYFFDRLSRLSRIVNVSNLNIEAKREPTISSTISATCTATTFVFIESSGTATPPGQPGQAAPPGR
jgi:Tfp pilus assembly protein PilO